MNRSIVRFLIAKLLLIESALLVVPLIVALIYQEDAKVFASILGTMPKNSKSICRDQYALTNAFFCKETNKK